MNVIKYGSWGGNVHGMGGIQRGPGLVMIHLPSVSPLALTSPFSDCCLSQVPTVVLEESRIKDFPSHSDVSVTLGRHIISR